MRRLKLCLKKKHLFISEQGTLSNGVDKLSPMLVSSGLHSLQLFICICVQVHRVSCQAYVSIMTSNTVATMMKKNPKKATFIAITLHVINQVHKNRLSPHMTT